MKIPSPGWERARVKAIEESWFLTEEREALFKDLTFDEILMVSKKEQNHQSPVLTDMETWTFARCL